MDRKQRILHELLQQDQEPFHLKTYLSDKRSRLNHSPPPATATADSGGFLRIPPPTAAVLAEAAARIQKQQIRNAAGLGCLFGSFLKLLKHRSSSRVIGNRDLKETENSEEIRISCSCSRLICRVERADSEERLRSSPIGPCRFPPNKFSGRRRRSPELHSPAVSPVRRAKQDKENSSEEEKEQCSPVSVLDTFFEDDDEHESLAGDEEDHDLERSYANIERARKQLLERLERFEKLAALDQVDLEEKLLETSGGLIEGIEFEDLPRGMSSRLKQNSMKMSEAYMKRLIGEGQGKMIMERSCRKWHLAREVGFVAVGMMVELEEWGRRWSETEEEVAAEVEAAIFGGLMEECFALVENDSTM